MNAIAGCYLCGNEYLPLTDEHIFPEAAGGTIARRILCKPCNDGLGLWVDAPYLSQKHIQLGRATYGIKGKRGDLPRPFPDEYVPDGITDGTRITIAGDFSSRVIPTKPIVKVTKDGEITLSLSMDHQDRHRIPKVIRTTLTRFFRTAEGKSLLWSVEEQEKAVLRTIDRALLTESRTTPIEVSLHGQWSIDLQALFVEHVKVLFEVCCIEFGNSFLKTPEGERIKTFLYMASRNEQPEWSLETKPAELGIADGVPPELSSILKALRVIDIQTNHLVLLSPTGGIVSMFGMGATLHSESLHKSRTSFWEPRLYLNSINGGRSGVFRLSELMHRHG
jgi:hypothetical protein